MQLPKIDYRFLFYTAKNIYLRGSDWAKMVKMIKFLFFSQKVSSGMGDYVPNFQGASGTRAPQNGGQRGGSFFSFSIENGKNILYILQEIFQRLQNCFFFHSSIKTEEVLFFIYIYIYIYIYTHDCQLAPVTPKIVFLNMLITIFNTLLITMRNALHLLF